MRTLSWLGRAAAVVTVAAATALVAGTPAHAATPVDVTYGPLSSTVTDSSTLKSLLLRCPVNAIPIGGSFRIVGGNGQVGIVSSYPFLPGGWFTGVGISATEDPDGYAGGWSLVGSPICVTAPRAFGVANGTASSNTDADVTVPCNAGSPGNQALIGGGFQGANTAGVRAAGPTGAGTGTRAEVMPSRVPGTPLPVTSRTETICADVRSTVVAHTTTADASDAKSTSVWCPGGTHVTGTGAELGGARDAALIDGIEVDPATNGVTATAHEDQIGTAAPWSLTVRAICAA